MHLASSISCNVWICIVWSTCIYIYLHIQVSFQMLIEHCWLIAKRAVHLWLCIFKNCLNGLQPLEYEQDDYPSLLHLLPFVCSYSYFDVSCNKVGKETRSRNRHCFRRHHYICGQSFLVITHVYNPNSLLSLKLIIPIQGEGKKSTHHSSWWWVMAHVYSLCTVCTSSISGLSS